MASRNAIIALAVAVVIIVGALSAMTYYSPASKPTQVTVRVGWLTGDLHHLAYFVANNREVDGGESFFERYGINATDATVGGYFNGAFVMDGFAAGAIDIAYLGTAPAITKHLNAGVNVTIVAQANEIGSALVTRGNITSLADLKGKTVAIPGPASIQYFLLLTLAEQEGVSVGEMSLVTLAPKDMRTALAGGQIDAFIAWEPYVADAVVNGVGTVYRYSSEILPHHTCCVIVVDKAFATAHPDVVVNFLRAHLKATDWINSAKARPESADYALLKDIAAVYTQRSPAVLEEALRDVDYKYEIDSAFLESVKAYTGKLFDYGIVSPEKLLDRGYISVEDFADRYVSETFLSQAKAKTE